MTRDPNAQTRASNKYSQKTYDRLNILVPKGERAKIRAHAERLGESLNHYVVRLIRADMEGDRDV